MLSSLLAVGIGVGIGFALGRWGSRRRPVSAISKTQTTPDRAVEEDLRDRLHQLQLDYQQMTEMGQFKAGFLARTSHELRSPLNGMIGMHQLILSDLCDDPAEERDFVAQANASALRMVDILDNLLSVARTEYGTQPLHTQPIQLAHLFQEVHLLTHLQAQNRNLQLEIALPDPDLYALADPRSLRQVLVKLIDGAIAHMDQGSIHLSVQSAPTPATLLIQLKDQRPATAWQEAIDLMRSDLPKTVEIPTPGLNFLAIHTLLGLMQGQLDVLELATPDQPFNCIQCTIPRALDD
jgi:signal transduction histidine kinase